MTKRWHNSSVFGPGRRVPLDREQKAQWKARLALQRYRGRVTLGAMAVGLALVGMLGAGGELFPTHETLAAKACVKLSTARRAVASLKGFGFLDWDRRLVRDGWRCAQTSNAYILRVPACEVHFARQVSLIERKKGEERGERGSRGKTDAEAFADRDRQLLALGFLPP